MRRFLKIVNMRNKAKSPTMPVRIVLFLPNFFPIKPAGSAKIINVRENMPRLSLATFSAVSAAIPDSSAIKTV